MIRFFDILFSILGLILFSPFFVILFFIGYFDTGSPIFSQVRMGKNKKLFIIYKFRSMKFGTLSVPTHVVEYNSLTTWGKVIRQIKLDELPQLVNVLIGQLSFVGPRPNLLNQYELIRERESRNVYSVKPGITGLAQIKNIDMSMPELLAEVDAQMITNLNLRNYFKYIIITLSGKGFGDKVRNSIKK
jgi:lipopolysaccharide/colanic/teichoic acid biosynthesis glycosyltransferase